jgi:hypothetical protein
MQNLIRPHPPQNHSTRFAGIRGLGCELGRGRRAFFGACITHAICSGSSDSRLKWSCDDPESGLRAGERFDPPKLS